MLILFLQTCLCVLFTVILSLKRKKKIPRINFDTSDTIWKLTPLCSNLHAYFSFN